MDNQLSSISTQYSKFSKGQYVEDKQFNELLDYFEDQDRLSRVMLQGVGVVCGFEPKLVYINNKVTGMSLSQGIAITTDGDLLTLNNKSKTKNVSEDVYMSELKTVVLDSKQYTHWKPYDNHKVMYPSFYQDEAQIELWELSTSAEAKSGFQPLASFPTLEDKCLLLYLESYEKEIRPCRGVDCDNHGVQQIQNLKVLVTTLGGAGQLMMADKVAPHPGVLSFEEQKLKRVIFTPVKQSPTSIRQAYKDVLTESSYSLMFDNMNIISEILGMSIANRFGFITALNSLSAQAVNFQYSYGVLKDLTDTYAEIIKCLKKSFSKSLPDLQSFPKHVMLGNLVSAPNLDFTRHKFYNSPVLDNDRMTQLKLLIERFNQQVFEFNDPSEGATEGIKITPSQDISSLGNKAIPFYYGLTRKFLNLWNFDKTRNRASNTNLSYDISLLSEALHVKDPIRYTIDNKSFFRIEGHQGMDYNDAAEYINDFKNDEQLGFDLMVLSLEDLRGNKDISKAYFTDYVAKHPGLEHLGGVKRGGTFVIVYESEDNPEVIADFALPYSCCIPKSDVGLSLPADEICGDSPTPLKFNVTPANGVVKAEVNGTAVNGVVKILGQYYFNPQLVENAWLDKKIGFTVNGKPTTCSLKVLSHLDIDIYARNIVHGVSSTTVTFNVSNQNTDDYEYKWDFLGDGKYVVVKPDSQRNVKYTYSEIDPENQVNVLISGNGCSQSVTLTDWYTPGQVEKTGPIINNVTSDTTNSYAPNGKAILSSFITEGSSTAITYQWTCSDSNVSFESSNSQTTEVNFPTAGSYMISLTVSDANNLTDTRTISVEVGTKASISGVSISPPMPKANDSITAQATVFNPDNISGLKFTWYLNNQFHQETSSNTSSFNNLSIGEKKIEVKISESLNNNHLSNLNSVDFTVSERVIGGTSFTGETLISMSSGEKRTIANVAAGEQVMSLNGTVQTVVDVVFYSFEENIYSLNEQDVFITGTHPVLTTEGWMSFEPSRTKAMIPSLTTVGQLGVGVTLIKENNQHVTLNKVTPTRRLDRFVNIQVDGSKVFFANGYCVYSEI